MEFFLLFLVLAIIFAICEHFDMHSGFLFTYCCIACVGFMTMRYEGVFDPEVRKQRVAESTKDSTPELRTVDMGNGCTMNYWFAQGPKNGFTKFVRCKDSKTVTFETYSCGTGKLSKTCTREVETK